MAWPNPELGPGDPVLVQDCPLPLIFVWMHEQAALCQDCHANRSFRGKDKTNRDPVRDMEKQHGLAGT